MVMRNSRRLTSITNYFDVEMNETIVVAVSVGVCIEDLEIKARRRHDLWRVESLLHDLRKNRIHSPLVLWIHMV